HWNFDGDAALPDCLDAGLVKKLRFDNPLATYGRLLNPMT
ncbi:MAG: hypothetical protein QOD93_1559, partial [Acetobacteraceae bacterium]|nr:hypothetical protein [Acetobacteraceae bacterium]